MEYTDIRYEKKDGMAWIIIDRPEVRNAFRTRTVAELTDAFVDARWDRTLASSCSRRRRQGLLRRRRPEGARAGGYSPDQRPMDVEALHSAIRHIPSPSSR